MCIQENYAMDGDQDGSSKDLDKRTLLVSRLPKSVTHEDLERAFSEVGAVRHCIVVTEKGSQESRGFGFVSFSLPEDAELALKELQGSSIKGQDIRLSYANRRERKSRGSEDANQEAKKPRIKAYRVDQGDLPKASRQTTPIVVVENTTVDAVNSVLQGLKKVVKVEEQDGAVVVVFNRFKTARAKISKLHGVKSDCGISHAFFQSEARRRERLIVRNLPFSAEEKELKEVFGRYGPLREVHVPKKPDGKARGFAFVEYFHGVDAMSAVKTANGAKLGSRTLAVDIAVAKNKYQVLQDEAVPVEDEQDQPGTADIKQNEREDDDEDAEPESSEEGDAEGDEEESEKNKRHTEPQRAESTDEEILRTVFVRNVLLETTANELRLELTTFGDVEHCVLVKDKATGRSRGSAFVRFRDQSSVPKILKESGYDTAAGRQVLEESDVGITVGGRRLLVVPAVSKTTAKDFVPESANLGGTMKKREVSKEDKRNLWLAHEGRIAEGDPAARGLSPMDLEKRRKAEKEKIKKLTSNPNIYVSKTRLNVRNLPLDVEVKALKQMFAKAGNVPLKGITSCKIVRDEARKDSSGTPRSKGYGFISFAEHEAALNALRMVNNNPKALATYLEDSNEAHNERRLIVEFSLEDARKVLILNKRLEKMRANQTADPEDGSTGASEGRNENTHAGRRRAKRLRSEEKTEAKKGSPESASIKPKKRKKDSRAANKEAPEVERNRKPWGNKGDSGNDKDKRQDKRRDKRQDKRPDNRQDKRQDNRQDKHQDKRQDKFQDSGLRTKQKKATKVPDGTAKQTPAPVRIRDRTSTKGVSQKTSTANPGRRSASEISPKREKAPPSRRSKMRQRDDENDLDEMIRDYHKKLFR
ncbi:hypothetical protein NDN08_004365 [Rhodosorus marinus]|uniref:RRM domain-containing protein n=1 Tax=Rhodosorus marinus TaxID=101924 RepID=A0AAV8UP60_9RHOD|nr:hypothetical protein NDN08_004365 [Rhodosorus marinus]